jgi:hypothetical protein
LTVTVTAFADVLVFLLFTDFVALAISLSFSQRRAGPSARTNHARSHNKSFGFDG